MDLSDRIQKHLTAGGAALVGFADISGLTSGELASYPRAVSFIMPMDPDIMAGLNKGPTKPYSRLYRDVNETINLLSGQVEQMLTAAGHQAWAVPASLRSDPANIRGDFPHKTAATRAGLGWIGKHCQLVTHKLGPWIRLATVLTDAPLPVAKPVERDFCGKCQACVEACPAGALSGQAWTPGIEREKILNAASCDHFKKTSFLAFEDGHNCGICTCACPFGQKLLRSKK